MLARTRVLFNSVDNLAEVLVEYNQLMVSLSNALDSCVEQSERTCDTLRRAIERIKQIPVNFMDDTYGGRAHPNSSTVTCKSRIKLAKQLQALKAIILAHRTAVQSIAACLAYIR